MFHFTAISRAESAMVIKREQSLQLGIIMDMIQHSTNASASKVAVQSLGAFHATEEHIELPQSVARNVERTFESCFRPVLASGDQYDLTASLADIERYARSLLLLPRNILAVQLEMLRYFLLEGTPKNLHIKALHAYAIRKGRLPNKPEELERLVNGILEWQPPVDTVKLHTWIHTQFTELILSHVRPHTMAERSQISEDLTKTLSLDTVPTLQDELRICALYNRVPEAAMFALDLEADEKSQVSR